LGRKLAPEQESKQRGLAGARRTGDEDELAALDLEADVLQRDRALRVGLREMIDLDQRRTTSYG
jgi:hypothetical protein